MVFTVPEEQKQVAPPSHDNQDGPDDGQRWHARPEAEVLRTLGAGREGLSWEEARSRLVQHGPNRLPVATGPSALALLARQVTSPLIYALLASAAVAFALATSRTARSCSRSWSSTR